MRKKLFAALLVMGALITGCGSKEAVTAETFTDKAEELGFEIEDMTYDLEDTSMTKGLYGINDNDVEVIFIVCEDSDSAASIYEDKKEMIVDEYEDGSKLHTNVSTGNYGKYSVTTDDEFIIVERIDDTLLMTYASPDNKDDVKAIVEAIGY